jgi:hypothetical protein
MAIVSVKAKHIQSGRIHYFNIGTWNHHQAVRRKSKVRVYKLIEMIHETAGQKQNNVTSRSIGEVEVVHTQPQARGMASSSPPPPKKRKKGCNC